MKDEIIAAFLAMKRQKVEELIQKRLTSGTDPFEILKVCRKAMEEVGKRFETGDFFLSELIYSAQVFKGATAVLEPLLVKSWAPDDAMGSVVFGTPKGDIHDLGKDIVITVMRAQGFIVHDLGVDVSPERFLKKLKDTDSRILAMSCLITPAFQSMKETIEMLHEEGIRRKTFVIVGGGVTTDIVRREVGADAQTMDPTVGVRLCREYLERLR